jgi:hypothetical protein
MNVQMTLARPEINLCIASLLRQEFPGTASADALYLDGADLRYLADTTRRLAGESAIQFAQLYELATAPYTATDNQLLFTNPLGASCTLNSTNAPCGNAWNSTAFLAPVRALLNNPGYGLPSTYFAQVANDYTQALQLFAATADNELDMERKDAFANTPRGGAPVTVPDRMWDPMSWYQRAGVTLYGGNTLATQRSPFFSQPNNGYAEPAPWQADGSNPYFAGGAAFFVSTMPPNYLGQQYWDWPTWDELPWVRNRVRWSGPNDLIQVALSFDALDLPMNTLSNPPETNWGNTTADESCLAVDTKQPGLATGFYNNVEQKVRNALCVPTSNPQGVCANTVPLTTTPALSGYILYNQYGLTVDDAQTALNVLHDELGWVCQGHSEFRTNAVINGSIAVGNPYPWSQSIGTPPMGGVDSAYHISMGTVFAPRDDIAMAGLFGRNAHFNLQRWYAWGGDATTQGFIDESLVPSWPAGVDWALSPTYPPPIWNAAALGANPTLSAAKLALVESYENTQSTGVNNTSGNVLPPNASQLFADQAALLGFIDGKVGSLTVALRPRIATFSSSQSYVASPPPVYDNGGSILVNGVYQYLNFYYDLDVVVPTTDPFWGSATTSQVLVYAIPNQPWSADLARFPSSSYFGQTIATLLAGGNGITSASMSKLATSIPAGSGTTAQTLQHFYGAIVLPGQFEGAHGSGWSNFYTVVAVNSATNKYSVLVDGFRATYDATGQGYFHSTSGGDPNSQGTQNQAFDNMRATSPVDPSQPLADPFNLPTNWVPPTNPQLYGGSPALSHYMSQAQTAAANATTAANTAIQSIIAQQTDQNMLAADRAQGQGLAQEAVQELCGSNAQGTSLPSQPNAPSCDTSSVHVTLGQVLGIQVDSASGLPKACLGGANLPGALGTYQGSITNPNTYGYNDHPDGWMASSAQDSGLLVGSPWGYVGAAPVLFSSPLPGTTDAAAGCPGGTSNAFICETGGDVQIPNQLFKAGSCMPAPTPSGLFTMSTSTPAKTLWSGVNSQVQADFAFMNTLLQPWQGGWDAWCGGTPPPTLYLPGADEKLGDAFALLVCYLQDVLVTASMNVSNVVAPFLIPTTPGSPAPPAAPSFGAYAGGTLAVDFSREWTDIMALQGKYQNLMTDINDAYVGMIAENAFVNAANAAYAQCVVQNQPNVFMTVLKDIALAASCIASVAASFTPAAAAGVPAAVGTCSAMVQQLASQATAINPVAACQAPAATANATSAQDQAQAVTAEGKMFSDLQDLMTQTGVVATDLAQIALDRQKAKDAITTAGLNQAVATSGLQTLTGEYVLVNSYNAATAGAQLDVARTYAVLARRAFESTYLISLDSQSQVLPLVDAPANWADNVYSYDLSLAQTIGNQTVGGSSSGSGSGVFPNALTLYVNNLQAVIDSVPVMMPSEQGSDTGLISFDGPLTTTTDPSGNYELTPGAMRWEFWCPNQGTWRPMPATERALNWTSVNTSVTGNNLTRTGSSGWNASAATKQYLSGSGYVQFTAPAANANLMAGLTHAVTDNSFDTIDFAIYLGAGFLYFYEQGAQVGPSFSYSAGDTFTVQATANQISYLKNGTVLYTSTKTATSPLYFDASIWSSGGQLSNVMMVGSGPGLAPTDASAACGGGVIPTQARRAFWLDPAMNLETQGPPTQRFNERWGQLAVNLVGSGIRNCASSSLSGQQQTACYTNPYLTANLLQEGPSVAWGWGGTVAGGTGNGAAAAPAYTLNIAPGFIDTLKALAAEEVLDPVSNGFSSAYVQAVARTELQGSPVSGMYTLTLKLGPEVQVQNIQGVQILAGQTFWVTQ